MSWGINCFINYILKYLLHLQVHSELLCCDTFFCVCRRTFFNILYASKLAGGLRIQSKARIRRGGTDEIEQQRVALRNRVALGNSSFLWLKSGRERENDGADSIHFLSTNVIHRWSLVFALDLLEMNLEGHFLSLPLILSSCCCCFFMHLLEKCFVTYFTDVCPLYHQSLHCWWWWSDSGPTSKSVLKIQMHLFIVKYKYD